MAEATTAQRKLTDRHLASVKGAAAPYDIRDTEVPGLRCRVMPSGERTFVLLARYSRDGNPTRRALGTYPILSLGAARDKAIEWKRQLKAGVDPSAEEERRRRQDERKREGSFAAVAEQFIAYIHRRKLRTAADMERDLRRVFVTEWGARPIADIRADDIKRIIRQAVDRGAKYQAFSDFALIRRLFNWSLGIDDHGLAFNPCGKLKPGDLIGERYARDRVLGDDELQALWRAAERMKYPFGPLYKILCMTGVRLNEACGARWCEVDLDRGEWIVPASRMKKVKGGARPHLVPLTDSMRDVMRELPRFNSGDFVFSNTFGKRPLRSNQFSDVKERLDALMLEELQGKPLPSFVNHDIRRTVRTHLSALRISEEVREAVLAHVRPGIKAAYDHYQYLDEKREALTLWNARLRSIVEPAAANVVTLRA